MLRGQACDDAAAKFLDEVIGPFPGDVFYQGDYEAAAYGLFNAIRRHVEQVVSRAPGGLKKTQKQLWKISLTEAWRVFGRFAPPSKSKLRLIENYALLDYYDLLHPHGWSVERIAREFYPAAETATARRLYRLLKDRHRKTTIKRRVRKQR